MRFFINSLFVIVCVYTSYAQELSLKVSQDTILVGEEIRISFEVKSSKKPKIELTWDDEAQASLGDPKGSINRKAIQLDLLEESVDTMIQNAAGYLWRYTMKATCFDSGIVYLENKSISVNDSLCYFPNASFHVFLVKPIDSLDIYDITENYADVPPPTPLIIQYLKSYWWIAVLLIAIIFAFRFIKKRKAEVYIPEPKTSLRDRTLRAIDALEAERLWEKNKLKSHFVELSFILRSYLASRYQIDLLESTTAQSKLLLRNKGLNEDTVNSIIRILSQSDLVKFAQSEPEVSEILKTVVLARQIVAETSPLDFEQIDD